MLTQTLLVSGQVQGVGFRWSVTKLANQLGVTGTVQNLANGQVAIVATADSSTLTDFAHQIQQGLAPWIRVTDITITPNQLQHFTAFRIII